MWWNGWKQLWEPVWLERLGWAPHPVPHWSPSDCPSLGRGGDGAPERLAWAATDREVGGSVSGWRGGTTLWDGSIIPISFPPADLFFSFFKRMCNYTPNCPAPPSNERSRNTWYLQVGRHKGAFATIGLQGLGVRLKKLAFNSGHPHQTKTDHLLWRKGAVYSVKANCSTSPLFFIQDCTTKHKGCRIGVEIVHNIWTCLKYWMLGWHVKDRKCFLSYFCQPFGKHTDEIFGLTHTRMIWTSVKCTVSCAAHLPSKGNGSSMTSIQATPSSTTLFLSKTGATDTWCTPDCSVYERGHDATYGQRVKIHTVPAVAAKNVLWLSVHTGIK